MAPSDIRKTSMLGISSLHILWGKAKVSVSCLVLQEVAETEFPLQSWLKNLETHNV